MFLKEITKWVKGIRLDLFFNKAKIQFKEIMQGKNDAELKEAAAQGVLLVEKLKEYADHPTVDMVISVIPGDWDSRLISKVKIVLPNIIEAYAKNSPCLDKVMLSEKVTCLIGNIKLNADASERTIFYHSLAAAIGAALSDGKFTISDLFLLVEPVFRLLKKKG